MKVCKFRENSATFSDLSGYGEYLFPENPNIRTSDEFVLEPENFSGKNWNSPINTGPASLLSGSSATEIQFQGSNDGITQGQPIVVAQAQFNVATTGVNEE